MENSGAAPTCLPECEPGYTFASNMCTATAGATCTAGTAKSIADECATLNRACSSGPPASCGICYVGFILAADGFSCRAVNTCSALGCGSAFRVCSPETAHTDAICGACQPGYTDSNGTCVPAGLQCSPGTPSGVEAMCIPLNRSCVSAMFGATCGPCNNGFVANPANGLCEPAVACTALNCNLLFRACSDVPNGHCTDCLSGFKLDPSTGLCRMPTSCATLTCDSVTEVCVDGGPG